jgi:phage gp16-like protein
MNDRATNSECRQRNGLLAKIHIAKQQMGLNDDEYEALLAGMKTLSAADLSVEQLERLVKYLKKLGWKPVRRRGRGHGTEARRDRTVSPERANDRLTALRTRCEDEAWKLDNGPQRLPGLVKKICGFPSLAWCRDAAKLERLLAVLGKIRLTESTKMGTCTGSPQGSVRVPGKEDSHE